MGQNVYICILYTKCIFKDHFLCKGSSFENVGNFKCFYKLESDQSIHKVVEIYDK